MVFFNNACQFPDELERSIADLGNLIGDRIIDSSDILSSLENDATIVSAGMDAVEAVIDKLLVDFPVVLDGETLTPENVPEVLGIDSSSDDTHNEKLLSSGGPLGPSNGILVFKRKAFVPGSLAPEENYADNIETFRKAYVMNNFNLNSAAHALFLPFTVSRSFPKISIVELEFRKVLTEKERRDQFSGPHIYNEFSYYNDGELKKTYLVGVQYIQDFDAPFVSLNPGIGPVSGLVSLQPIYKANIDIRLGAIKEYSSLVLEGKDLKTSLNAAAWGDRFKEANLAAQKAQNSLTFYLSRFDKLPPSSQGRILQKIIEEIDRAILLHQEAFSLYSLRVAIGHRTDTLEQLRNVFDNDEEIKELLEKRADIKGIWFGATNEELTSRLNEMALVQDHSKLLSSSFLKLRDERTGELLTPLAFLAAAKEHIGRLSSKNSTLVQVLENVQRYTELPLDFNLLQGKPKAPSSASSLSPYLAAVDSKSFKMPDIDRGSVCVRSTLPPGIAEPLIQAIKGLVRVSETALGAVDFEIKKAEKSLLLAKKKMDAVFSKMNVLLGLNSNIGISTGILSCNLNFKNHVKLPVFDQLIGLLDTLQSNIIALASIGTKWITNILEAILCIPGLIMDTLQNQINKQLDALGCAVKPFPFQICDDMLAEINKLRQLLSARQSALQAFANKLSLISVEFETLPGKIDGLKRSDACGSFTISKALSNIGASLDPGSKVGALLRI